MLKYARIILASLFLVGTTLLFFGIGTGLWGWMAKVQFLPAVLGMNLAVVGGVLLMTLLLGRLYCSIICPLGVLQDLIISLRRRTSGIFAKRKARKRYSFKPVREIKWLRYGVLTLYIAALSTGFQTVVVLLAPYSSYGRMVRSVAGIADGSSPLQLILASGLMLAAIAVLAWTSGRIWCNAICPVGTTLGLLSRFSLFKVRIDEASCIGCRKCERACKSGAIDIRNGKTIDYSRCVDCFECIGACGRGGIRFSTGKTGKTQEVDRSKRRFLAASILAAGNAALAQAATKAGKVPGAAKLLPKADPKRRIPPVPVGAENSDSFYSRCTGCNLCVSNCPNGVLKTSTDLEHFLQPRMSFTDGWCHTDCVTCSTVCPAGAIKPVTQNQKAMVKIGFAAVNLSTCLMATRGAKCGICIKNCPTGAISRAMHGDGKAAPSVDREKCIGCGSCENHCPVRPVSAITVEGVQ